jgi:hypothetical protein
MTGADSGPRDDGAWLLTVGAVKVTTGHLEGSAGLAGLAAALAAQSQRAALPLRFRLPNPWVASSLEGWGTHCRCEGQHTSAGRGIAVLLAPWLA